MSKLFRFNNIQTILETSENPIKTKKIFGQDRLKQDIYTDTDWESHAWTLAVFAWWWDTGQSTRAATLSIKVP